ncbi:hypothetical protein C8J57DRAFT_1219184 [Mycena rebaudengoi]|nr:hypothetical protein C8J57DRAFT_1219184 [Mycena rebaudengoi]
MTQNSVAARARRKTLDGNYIPTTTSSSAEKKAASHRLAVHKHYIRNAASIREKRRLQMAEKVAAKKLKRRQWDPPKKQVVPPSLESDSHDEDEGPARSIVFHDYRAESSTSGDIGELRPRSRASEGGAALGGSTSGTGDASDSPTDKERPASGAMLSLANVEVENKSSHDSIFEKALDLSSLGSMGCVYPDTEVREREHNVRLQSLRAQHAQAEFGIHLEPGRLPSGTAPLSLRQEMELERTGFVGELSRVQAAQIRIFSLNSGDLQSPTEDEIERWVVRRIPLWTRMETRNPYLSSTNQTFIGRWVVKVCTAVHHRGESPEEI